MLTRSPGQDRAQGTLKTAVGPAGVRGAPGHHVVGTHQDRAVLADLRDRREVAINVLDVAAPTDGHDAQVYAEVGGSLARGGDPRGMELAREQREPPLAAQVEQSDLTLVPGKVDGK